MTLEVEALRWTAEDEARWKATHCRLVDSTIVCNECGKPADTVHFLPWVVARSPQERRIEAACQRHDPGGYWIEIADLAKNLGRWLAHLSEKHQAPHAALVAWLGYSGGMALDRLRACCCDAGANKGNTCD